MSFIAANPHMREVLVLLAPFYISESWGSEVTWAWSLQSSKPLHQWAHQLAKNRKYTVKLGFDHNANSCILSSNLSPLPPLPLSSTIYHFTCFIAFRTLTNEIIFFSGQVLCFLLPPVSSLHSVSSWGSRCPSRCVWTPAIHPLHWSSCI